MSAYRDAVRASDSLVAGGASICACTASAIFCSRARCGGPLTTKPTSASTQANEPSAFAA
jgi:hypothetical protein